MATLAEEMIKIIFIILSTLLPCKILVKYAHYNSKCDDHKVGME